MQQLAGRTQAQSQCEQRNATVMMPTVAKEESVRPQGSERRVPGAPPAQRERGTADNDLRRIRALAAIGADSPAGRKWLVGRMGTG